MRAYHCKDAKEASETRVAATQDRPAISTQTLPTQEDTPVTSAAIRGRPTADVVGNLQCPAFVPDKRCKRDALRAAFVADKSAEKERAQWRNSDLKPQADAPRPSAVAGVEEPILAWVADDCNQVLGQDLSEEKDKMQADIVTEAKVKKLDAWGTFKVPPPPKAVDVKKTAAVTR